MFLPGHSDNKFFDLLLQSAANTVDVAEMFRDLCLQMERYHEVADQMKALESRGDTYTRELLGLLNRYFVTPFDREEIFTIAVRLDDYVDAVEAATARLDIYDLRQHDRIVSDFGRILLEQAQAIESGIKKRTSKKLLAIHEDCVRINELENQGDQLLREGLRAIFSEPTDVVRLIQLKEVYETLEEATDRAEDVADVLETLVVRNA